VLTAVVNRVRSDSEKRGGENQAFSQIPYPANSREEQLFLERISIAMFHSVPSGAAFLNGKAAFAPAVLA
jgi:hypothetical protein